MAFMEEEIYGPVNAYVVGTKEGPQIIPEDVCGPVEGAWEAVAGGGYIAPVTEEIREQLQDYVVITDETIMREDGVYVGRLSAPGYLDCTPWDLGATEDVVRAVLREVYGSDDDEEAE